MQSVGLAMKGADGRSYTFRTSDKDPKRILPPEWGDTVPARLFQDSTTANHPGVGFVVPPLAEAAGVLHTTPRYVFMPDDPALGEFRKTFGGQPGTIEEFPLPGPGGAPGFAGAIEIVSTASSGRGSSPARRAVDDRALLRARLFDLWIQDWDRHNKQWRWLRRGKDALFEPLPEDRDQAFSRFSGLLLSMARGTHPKFMDFDGHYQNFEGWMTQGGEVDRWLLSAVGRAAFEETARDLAARLTDGVIDDAVGRLPPEWYALDGARLAAALKKRRDGLLPAALEFYARLASKVDVHATDLADSVRVTRGGETAGSRWRSRALPARRRGSTGASSATRRARCGSTSTRDRIAVMTSGPPAGRSRCAWSGAAAGPRRRLEERRHALLRRGRELRRGGPRHRARAKAWERQPAKPKETPWLEWRDWGSRTLPQYKFWWEPDPAADAGGGFTRQTWGFRKSPYSTLQTVQLQYSTGRDDFKFNYDGEFRRENSNLYFVVDAQASGLENLNYFGFGNQSSNAPPEGSGESYYDADSDTYELFLSSWWAPARTLEFYAGPEVKLTDTAQSGFIGSDQPTGLGQFGQVGVKAGFDLDTRGHPRTGTLGDQFRADGKPARSGVRLKAEGQYYPDAWDANGFGGVEGTLRGYLAGRRAMLAARVGGRKVWGEYPWFEAAFVGGSKSLRGYRKNRFAGDASLYGSVEARLWLFKGRLIAPGRWGCSGSRTPGASRSRVIERRLAHVLRRGVFFQMLTLNTVFHGAVAHGDEGTRFYVDYGFAF